MYAADMFRSSLRRMLSLFHKNHQLFTSVDDAGELVKLLSVRNHKMTMLYDQR